MKQVILADNQELTNAGWRYILKDFSDLPVLNEVHSKADLLPLIKTTTKLLVICDYSLFDFSSVNELILLHNSFQNIDWIICSDDLSDEFLRMLVSNTFTVSLFTKSTSSDEIRIGLKEIINGNRYICNSISNSLLQISLRKETQKKQVLTATEIDILKDIASGKTTKEIASQRFISIHTVMTHRKNIFRKIEVNNIHEATKYAMRAGLIDMAEYYI